MLSLTQDVKKTSENSILTTIAPLKEAVLPNDIGIYLEETESIEGSKYDMLVRFNNHLEFNDFYTSLSDKWLKDLDVNANLDMSNYINPISFLLEYDYFILYSIDTNKYDIDTIEYEHGYIIIQLDVEQQAMFIRRFYIEKPIK